MRSYLISAILFFCSSIINHVAIAGGVDDWCDVNCSSFEKCAKKFQDDFADLQLKIGLPDDRRHSEIGSDLIYGAYFGDKVARQTFETQFVNDVSVAIGESICRIYIRNIAPLDDALIVTFRIYPTLIHDISFLTQLAQDSASALYHGKVTSATDAEVGLVVHKWDLSLRLAYSINIIGGGKDADYLNEGSELWCEDIDNVNSPYCEFELYFREDIVRSLGLVHLEEVRVLFVKPAGKNSVLVYFRFVPYLVADSAERVGNLVINLGNQLADTNSFLYGGNVTIRVDPTWGVSGKQQSARKQSPFLPFNALPTTIDEYERCKVTQRCSRGWVYYDQHSGQSFSTSQAFAGGDHTPIPLFANFEDWRQGTVGWRVNKNDDEMGNGVPPSGAHFSPMDFLSLGPSVPSYNTTSNNGLVLNHNLLEDQKKLQSSRISDIEEKISWLKKNIDIAIMNAERRSRADVKIAMSNTLADHETLLEDQQSRMQTLSSSQCVNTLCELVFNTSSLDLTGAVNATGTLVTQDDGTEIALWAFDSINLMTDVNVTLVGQRAMALLARSSIYIDAIFLAKPGTLGGFPGGYSVSRNSDHKLISVCDPDIKSSDGITSRRSCAGDVPLSQLTNASVVSNNVNGPGSGSARVYLKTIEIVAPIQNEIQVIMTNADAGQTIAGGFKLHYNGYSTAFLRHDITASALKYNIENSLNGANINILAKVNRTDFRPGIGEVSVSREVNGGSGGFTWAITFVSAVGNSDTISSTNLLSGTNANVIVETIQEGNSVGGMFQVGFLGFWTRNLSHAVSSSEMESAFLHDIPILETASVVRTDAANNCSDGFCTNGPTRAGGYIWTVTLTTQEGNISPGSPTSAKFEAEAPFAFMNATSKLLTGCIHLECPSMVVTDGHFRSNIAQMRNLVSAKPFSFAYGGAGAGYGGKGGEGFGLNPPGKEYGDDKISSLIGGSGGALGYVQPFEANLFSKPTGRGGSGGGAVEIVAMNDIVLGPNGRLLFDAEGGHGGMWTAGGGGSGGAVLLSAGGIVKVDGKISVTGGNGGIAIDPHGRSDIEDGHGGGGAGGRVAINAQSIVFGRHGRSAHVDIVGGDCKKIHSDEERTRSCDGRNGTLYLDESFSSDIFVDTLVGGAENTGGSLYIKSKQQVSNECEDGTHFGPSYDLGNATKPDRISFYARLDIDGDELRKYQHVSSNGGGLTFELLQENKESNLDYQRALLGLYVGAKMKHGSSYLGDGDCSRHLKSLQSFLDETQYKRWYKIDIRLNWSLHMYDILLDDVQAVRQAPFVGKSIKSINIGNSHPFITAWVDEIYIGNDFSMGFRCPVAGPHGIESSARPIQTGWKSSDIGGNSYNHPMQRHESHLSRRAVYSGPDHGNLVPFDGEGHRAFHSDIKFRHPTGDHEESLGDFNAGAITVISDRGAGKNYFMWYGEHENTHNSSNASSFDEILLGGVAACSSEDLITWKNEGLMLNYLNITDMVEGTSGPFRVERPKVLYNNMTSKYVMWMTVDNDERELGMAGVAISDFANGPFDFVRSFYPDGNETHDQTIFIDGDVDGEGRLNSTAYLVRTYYATIEYVLPAAVMQPMWESVKNIDGSTHFGLTYHRANYEPGYDNYHDIYLQRWRKEDIPWKVVCVDRSTGNEREVPYGKENLNHDGEICHGATEYKKVLGQGSPLTGPVKSRFLDPTDPANNVWVPNSVPGVKAQPWDANYKDGPCGVRELDDDIEILDADVDFADLSNEREKRSCASTKSNLVDNPIHPTPPDLLIGQETVVTSRRAKFVAINELTDDYLDTTGRTHVFEGELEDNADLGRLLWGLFEGGASGKINKFGWEVNDANLSGYSATPAISRMGDFGFETAEDWDTRFHQYEENYNDRAEYSLSCVIDGNCPANFRDQIAQA